MTGAPRVHGREGSGLGLEKALVRPGLADHDRLTSAVAKGYCTMGWMILRRPVRLGFLLAGCAAATLVAVPPAHAQGGADSATRAGQARMPSAADTTGGAGLRPLTSSYDTTRADSTVQYAAMMGIDEVVEATTRNSPSIAQANGAVRTGRSGERVAYGELLPSLTMNSGIFQTNEHSLILTSPGTPPAGPAISYQAQAYSLGLAASYDVFTGGRRTADIKAAKANTRSADAALIEQRYAVRLTARAAFYQVRRSRDLVGVSLERVTTADRALQYADARMRRGTATRADVLLARLNLTTAHEQLIAARDTFTTSVYALGRLVGVDGAVGTRGGDTLPSPDLALADSALVALAIHGSPGVRTADELARATDATVRSTQTQYVPDIRLTGGYNWANNSEAFGSIRPGWLVELGTTFPLFNGFQREDDVTRASATAHTAQITAIDTRRFARAEAERLLASVRFTWQNVAESEEAVRVSQEDLRVVSVRYQNGVDTFLDLSTAQLAEAQAGVDLVTARYNYLIARASLEALVGRDL
jgi:outer membrane protein